MRYYKLLYRRVDYIIVFGFVIIPILINPYALWDGAILNYSSSINAPEVIASIFNEAGAPLATCLNLFIYYFSYLSGMESKLVYSIFISGFTFVLYNEIIKMLSFRLSLNSFERIFVAFAFCALPFWSSFLADIYINYVFFTLCTVASVNLLIKKSYIYAFFLACVSINLKTNIILHPLLFLIIVFFPNSNQNEKRWNLKIILLFYMSLVLVFVLQQFFIKPYGSYSGYNGFLFSKIFEFFFDPKVYMKLAFFVPMLILFSFSKVKVFYYVFSALSLGLIGVFYIADKFSYVSILDFESYVNIQPYVLRIDIAFYLFIFLLSAIYFVSLNSKTLKFVSFFLYFLFFLPQRYYADLKMSEMVSNIRSVYQYFESNDDLVGKTGLIRTDIQGASVANYHYYKIFGDTKKISHRALNSSYQTDFCVSSASSVYKKKGICNDFDDWSVIYNPPISYSSYSVGDLWFK